MATWRDGPEYAPAARPVAFAAPKAAELAPPAPVADLSAGAPIQPPAAFAAPTSPTPDLATIAAPAAETRDARKPFEVVAATVTAGPMAATSVSAWGAAHSSSAPQAGWGPPATGLAPGSWGPPGGVPGQMTAAPGAHVAPQGWGGPAAGWTGAGWAPPQPIAPPATFGNAVKAAGVPLVVILAVACLVLAVAPVLLLIAIPLGGKITYSRTWLWRVLGAAVPLALLLGLTDLTDGGASGFWNTAAGWACLFSWLLLPAILIAQYMGLSNARAAAQTRP